MIHNQQTSWISIRKREEFIVIDADEIKRYFYWFFCVEVDQGKIVLFYHWAYKLNAYIFWLNLIIYFHVSKKIEFYNSLKDQDYQRTFFKDRKIHHQ